MWGEVMSRQRRRSGAGGGHLKTKWCTFIYTEYHLMLPRRRPVTWCCVRSCCGPESAWRRHAGALLNACKTARAGNQIFRGLLTPNVRYLQDFFRITNKEINEWIINDKCPVYSFNRLELKITRTDVTASHSASCKQVEERANHGVYFNYTHLRIIHQAPA